MTHRRHRDPFPTHRNDDGRLMPRYYRRTLETADREARLEAIREAPDDKPVVADPYAKPGDTKALRGIPCFGFGGTIAQTDPYEETARRDEQRRRARARIGV